MVAFATTDELAARMRRDFSEEEELWLNGLLGDATAYLRREIGQLVYPRQTVTFKAFPSAGWVDLPQWPVVSVDVVERGGVPVKFEERPGMIRVRGVEPVDVTFTFGFAEVPRDLTALACVLVSQQLTLIEADLGLAVGGLSSVALDDFKVAFANGGEQTGMVLPKVTVESLRQAYGRGTVFQADVIA